MTGALRAYEESHRELCKLEQSEDQFYGFSKGANRLAKYVQWVYVPAVKDATTEQAEGRNTALGKLLARTVRVRTKFDERLKEIRQNTLQDYLKLLAENQGALNELSISLQKRIEEWAHPEASIRLEWRTDPEQSVNIREPFAQVVAGEHEFMGDLFRFGHGLRRSYLLALLEELAATPSGDTLPRLILGCEEPELYQHPPQAKHLAEVFKRLGDKNSQVIVCTHSPYFVSGDGFENVRMVRKDPPPYQTTIASFSNEVLMRDWAEIMGAKLKKPEGILAKIHQELQPQLNELFFTNALILVEGLEDIAYITTHLHLTERWEEYRRHGCHLVAAGGKSKMIFALLVARQMGIPTYLIFDSDSTAPDKNGSRQQHERDNCALLKLAEAEVIDPRPKETVWGPNYVMWASEITEIVRAEIGSDLWMKCQTLADADYGHPGGLHKNSLAIATALTYAFNDGKISESLDRLCSEVIAFGPSSQPGSTVGDLAASGQ